MHTQIWYKAAERNALKVASLLKEVWRKQQAHVAGKTRNIQKEEVAWKCMCPALREGHLRLLYEAIRKKADAVG